MRVEGVPGLMVQFIGTARLESGTAVATVRDLLLSLSPLPLRQAADELAKAERSGRDQPSEESGLALAQAYAGWGDAGGWRTEVEWDACTTRCLGQDLAGASPRPLTELSGGEQKRLALELLLQSSFEVLLLDEPDNFLDVPGKEWLEARLNSSTKTILYVSHDRQLLANTSHRVVTLEGHGSWTHGGTFSGYHEARDRRLERLDDEHRRWKEERRRLVEYMRTMKQRAAVNDSNASRARAAETRLRHFDAAGPPPDQVRDQSITMRLSGGRTGKRVVRCEALQLTGLTQPFHFDAVFGDRVGVLGLNGTGKSHFLKLLAGEAVAHTGGWVLGARVTAGYFSQTHEHPELVGRRVIDILAGQDLSQGPAMAHLRRYELHGCAQQTFETLSGGQQARLQVLLLELGGATLLLLDEPTDNLDLASAEALETALAGYEGTVLTVTHDRWLVRSFDRYLVFNKNGTVEESPDPAYV